MAGDFQYVKLPDGSYGKFAGDAPDAIISATIQKQFPQVSVANRPGIKAPNTRGVQAQAVQGAEADIGPDDPALNSIGKLVKGGAQPFITASAPNMAYQGYKAAKGQPNQFSSGEMLRAAEEGGMSVALGGLEGAEAGSESEAASSARPPVPLRSSARGPGAGSGAASGPGLDIRGMVGDAGDIVAPTLTKRIRGVQGILQKLGVGGSKDLAVPESAPGPTAAPGPGTNPLAGSSSTVRGGQYQTPVSEWGNRIPDSDTQAQVPAQVGAGRARGKFTTSPVNILKRGGTTASKLTRETIAPGRGPSNTVEANAPDPPQSAPPETVTRATVKLKRANTTNVPDPVEHRSNSDSASGSGFSHTDLTDRRVNDQGPGAGPERRAANPFDDTVGAKATMERDPMMPRPPGSQAPPAPQSLGAAARLVKKGIQ